MAQKVYAPSETTWVRAFLGYFDMEPLGKGRARSTKSGHHFTPKRTREWEAAFAALLSRSAESSPELDRLTLPLTCPLHVVITAVKQRPKTLMGKRYPDGEIYAPVKPDADNIAKSVLDASMAAAVVRSLRLTSIFNDDAQVVDLRIIKRYTSKTGAPYVSLSIHIPSDIEE